MPRKVLTALVLAFSLLASLPALAAEAPAAPDLDLTAELAPEPNLTPADQPMDLGELDIEKELRQEKIGLCEYPHQWERCPGGEECCIVHGSAIHCLC